jgi:predicted dinucleotide-binding enzyme
MKLTIAVVGLGEKENRLAEMLASTGNSLLLSDTDESIAGRLAKELEARFPKTEIRVNSCSFECCWEADLIIPSGNEATIRSIASRIGPVANRKIVLSFIEKNEAGTDSRFLNEAFPHSFIVTANEIMKAENGTSGKASITVTGDDEDSVATVKSLFAGMQLSGIPSTIR